MSPIYDFFCEECGKEDEILCKMDENIICPECGKLMQRKCNCTNFKLVYDNKKDCCDWQGNSSNYWKDVKAARDRGEKVKGINEV